MQRTAFAPRPAFTPQIVDLPDAWPPCRASRCGSTCARARIDDPLGPVEATCENGHFRGYRAMDEFRRGGRYAGLFGDAAITRDVPAGAPERLVDPGPRRRTEALEDAVHCALCGTPPAEHPLHPEDAVRTDRELFAWLRRWRPDLPAEIAGAVALARGDTRGWRLAVAPQLRERVVDALRASTLTTAHVIAPEHLVPVATSLTKRELAFAVNGLLIAVCLACAARRVRQAPDLRTTMHTYVDARYGGDETLARADATSFRTMEKIASAVARAHGTASQRTA